MSFFYSEFSGESLELSIGTVLHWLKSGHLLPYQGMPELGLIMEFVEGSIIQQVRRKLPSWH